MSSSQSSSSSSSPTVPPALPSDAPAAPSFAGFLDVSCPVSIVLGTGSISVQQCLALDRNSVLRLGEPAGTDVQVWVDGVPLARGEVIVTDDGAAVRVTEFLAHGAGGER
jgi:flagellar motor switch protein FliN/FliY